MRMHGTVFGVGETLCLTSVDQSFPVSAVTPHYACARTHGGEWVTWALDYITCPECLEALEGLGRRYISVVELARKAGHGTP